MRSILLIFLFPLTLAGQTGAKPFTVQVELGSIEKVIMVYLEYYPALRSKHVHSVNDSLKPASTSFSFKGSIEDAWTAHLNIKYNFKFMGEDVERRVTFFLVPGITKIQANLFGKPSFSGPDELIEFNQLKITEEEYESKGDSLYEQYFKYKELKDEAKIKYYDRELDRFSRNKKEFVYLSFYKKNPGSLLAPYALMQVIPNDIEDPDKYLDLFELMPGNLQKLPQMIKLKETIERSRNKAIGKKIPDFVQQDINGKKVNTSFLRGKYVLIEFWASWCIPCRALNPELIRVYNEFKDKDFTILGVALEEKGKKEAWLKAIEKDGLEWLQVTDFKSWDNEISKYFGIRSIPYNILIDKNGIIVGKDLYGSDLTSKLREFVTSN